MTMSKCFTTVFDQQMKEHGFKRKGVLYYRLNGTTLQGIKLKQCNPYIISFNAYPYWIHRLNNSMDLYRDLGKGYWAEVGGSYLINHYYQKEKPELNERAMQYHLENTCKFIIPYLDKIHDEERYLDTKKTNQQKSSLRVELPSYARQTSDSIMESDILNQYVLLWIAYSDRSFARVRTYFDERMKLSYESQYQSIQNTIDESRRSVEEFNRCPPTGEDAEILLMFWESSKKTLERYQNPEQIRKETEEYIETVKRIHYKVFLEKMQEEDLDWIEGIYQTESSAVKEALQKELKLNVDML